MEACIEDGSCATGADGVWGACGDILGLQSLCSRLAGRLCGLWVGHVEGRSTSYVAKLAVGWRGRSLEGRCAVEAVDGSGIWGRRHACEQACSLRAGTSRGTDLTGSGDFRVEGRLSGRLSRSEVPWDEGWMNMTLLTE